MRGRVSWLLVTAVAAGLSCCAVLGLASVALASGGVTVKSHYWEIGINDGPSHKVAAGKTFEYCSSQTVGDITAKVILRAPIPAGKDVGYGLDGPGAAGSSLFTDDGPSDGRGTVITAAFIPLTFPKLKAKDASAFPAGSYRFILKVGGHQVLTEQAKLVVGGACS